MWSTRKWESKLPFKFEKMKRINYSSPANINSSVKIKPSRDLSVLINEWKRRNTNDSAWICLLCTRHECGEVSVFNMKVADLKYTYWLVPFLMDSKIWWQVNAVSLLLCSIRCSSHSESKISDESVLLKARTRYTWVYRVQLGTFG